MFTLQTKWGETDNCFIVKHGKGKNVRYDIFNDELGPMATLNLPGYGKSETVVAFKDYSENEGLLDWAKKVKLVKKWICSIPVGYTCADLVELDTKVLKSMMDREA